MTSPTGYGQGPLADQSAVVDDHYVINGLRRLGEDVARCQDGAALGFYSSSPVRPLPFAAAASLIAVIAVVVAAAAAVTSIRADVS